MSESLTLDVPALPTMEDSVELVQSQQPELVEGDQPLLRTPETGPKATVMIVDDEPVNIKVVQKYLERAGYDRFINTSESREAIELIRDACPDIILLDIMMPHINGLEILEVMRGDIKLQHVPVLILTAATDDEIRFRALEMGATDFLNKPVQAAELIPRIRNALIVKAHHDNLAKYSAQLEHEVRMRTAELAQSREEIIRVLACAAEYRDRETGNHVLRVGRYAGIIARELGFDRNRAELIGQAAILHDAGKIGISDSILLKPGKLTDEENQEVKNHCEYGMNILLGKPTHAHIPLQGLAGMKRLCESPILRVAATVAISHHERWDGTGYPLGLAGERIPIEGRITAVADVFDALSSRRPYKGPLPLDECFDVLEQGRGTHFDPQVLDAFFARSDEVVRVAFDLADD